jgi:hypothetical protein
MAPLAIRRVSPWDGPILREPFGIVGVVHIGLTEPISASG